MEETLQRLSLPVILGLAAGAALVLLLAKYPGEPLQFDEDAAHKKDDDALTTQEAEAKEVRRLLESMPEEDIMRQLKPLADRLHMSEDQLRQAVQQSKREGLGADEGMNPVKALDALMRIVLLVGGLWYINSVSKGQLLMYARGLFPREVEFLFGKAENHEEQEL